MVKGMVIFAVLFLIIAIVFKSSQSSPPDKLEVFLKQNNASQEIAEAYRFALENPQRVLDKVKCYCGCLNNGAGHKNNRDCFFNDDGTFDLMGLNCGLCIKTALISKQMLAEGKSVQEISDYIDSRWQKE